MPTWIQPPSLCIAQCTLSPWPSKFPFSVKLSLTTSSYRKPTPTCRLGWVSCFLIFVGLPPALGTAVPAVTSQLVQYDPSQTLPLDCIQHRGIVLFMILLVASSSVPAPIKGPWKVCGHCGRLWSLKGLWSEEMLVTGRGVRWYLFIPFNRERAKGTEMLNKMSQGRTT